MEKREFKATEQITGQQALQMIKAEVNRKIEAEPDNRLHIAIECGYYSALLTSLILKNPTEVMAELYFIQIDHEIHEFTEEGIETTFIEKFNTEEIAELSLRMKQAQNPEKKYRLIKKIYQKWSGSTSHII